MHQTTLLRRLAGSTTRRSQRQPERSGHYRGGGRGEADAQVAAKVVGRLLHGLAGQRRQRLPSSRCHARRRPPYGGVHQCHGEPDEIEQCQRHAAERCCPAWPSGVAATVEDAAPVPEGGHKECAQAGLYELDVVHEQQDERGSQQEHGSVPGPPATPGQPAGDEQQPDGNGQQQPACDLEPHRVHGARCERQRIVPLRVSGCCQHCYAGRSRQQCQKERSTRATQPRMRVVFHRSLAPR